MKNAYNTQGLTRTSLTILVFLLILSPLAAKDNSIAQKAQVGIGKHVLPVNTTTWVMRNWRLSDALHHHPIQAPAGSLPINNNNNNEQGENDERENPGDEDDGYKIHLVPYETYDVAVRAADVSIIHFFLSVLNRPKISLVVLHHSWKSFLY